MKIYYVPNASSLAIHIVLEWVEQNVESIKANFFDEILYKVNPIGTAGTLECDDGHLITQVPAILKYLDASHPEQGLGADGDIRQAADIDRWLSFLCSDVHHAFHLLFNPDRYAITGNDAAREAALKLCYRNFDVIEKHLEGKTYMLGDKKTIVDAYVFPMIRWSYIQFPEVKRNYTNINALHDRLLEDSDVVKAMKREGIVGTIVR